VGALRVAVVSLGLAAAAAAQDRPRRTGGPDPAEPLGPLPLKAGGVVLYDQYNNPANFDVVSQDVETALDGFDSFAADDFVIPAGETWSIEGVEVDGEYNVGPAQAFHVFFHVASGSLPGVAGCTRLGNPFTPGPGAGDAVITLTSPCVIPPGTYWVSVQARQDFNPAGQWFWQNRTVQSGNPSAWQNPGGGFGSPCASWGVKTACLPGQVGPDQVFRLTGIVVPVELQGITVE
jgi:hypothetical protein